MIIQIEIKTPKGYAHKIESKLRPFIIGFKASNLKIKDNEEDDKIIWIIESDIRKCNKIIRNVSMYHTIVDQMFHHKLVKKAVDKSLDIKGQEELKDMLFKQTTVKLLNKSFSNYK